MGLGLGLGFGLRLGLGFGLGLGLATQRTAGLRRFLPSSTADSPKWSPGQSVATVRVGAGGGAAPSRPG